MTTLALEFSSDRRSAALARGGRVLSEAVETLDARGTHAFTLIEKLLADAGAAREDIQTIAVGLGPGSYAGIRAAIAVAQGWQLVRGVKLLGISSVESLAVVAQSEKMFGRVNLVVDAQRGEFYLATWEISAGCRREILPLGIVAAAEIAARKSAGETCLGPANSPPLYPSASAITALAADGAEFLPGERLEPIYLRETAFVKAPVPRVL